MGGETTNVLDTLSTNHISGIAEARVVKSRAQVSYIKSQHTEDILPVKRAWSGSCDPF